MLYDNEQYIINYILWAIYYYILTLHAMPYTHQHRMNQ